MPGESWNHCRLENSEFSIGIIRQIKDYWLCIHDVGAMPGKSWMLSASVNLFANNMTLHQVVSIEESGFFKRLHLADGIVLETKVLIGCDGGNSVVAKWLGLEKHVSTGNVCVSGDALHPMTLDLEQGVCSALEDGVVLVRCLFEALSKLGGEEINEGEEYKRIEMGLRNFPEKRRWRSFDLITTDTAYVVGFIHQNSGMIMNCLQKR
ncbi:hypothetical protein V6N12_062645 [Hibiscus sabdariffa]|uniref:FAD-binding domain-containing protein n=1 Tax=Hibiscus sabdariffa TaxID=183260 RepID=A0ABR2F9H7_9ROSI